MGILKEFTEEEKARAIQERAGVEANAKRLQAVYDNIEEFKALPTGTQSRIYKQLRLMWELHDILGRRIAEEEFH